MQTSDLIGRLRDSIGEAALGGWDSLDEPRQLMHEAANEIEQLRLINETLAASEKAHMDKIQDLEAEVRSLRADKGMLRGENERFLNALYEISRRIPGLGYQGVGEVAREALAVASSREPD